MPSECRKRRLSGLPAVAKMRAPARRAKATAARPTPPAAAWIRTLWPALRPPVSKSASRAVMNALGSVPPRRRRWTRAGAPRAARRPSRANGTRLKGDADDAVAKRQTAHALAERNTRAGKFDAERNGPGACRARPSRRGNSVRRRPSQPRPRPAPARAGRREPVSNRRESGRRDRNSSTGGSGSSRGLRGAARSTARRAAPVRAAGRHPRRARCWPMRRPARRRRTDRDRRDGREIRDARAPPCAEAPQEPLAGVNAAGRVAHRPGAARHKPQAAKIGADPIRQRLNELQRHDAGTRLGRFHAGRFGSAPGEINHALERCVETRQLSARTPRNGFSALPKFFGKPGAQSLHSP